MGLLKGMLNRHQSEQIDEDEGPVWQALPDLELHDVRVGSEELAWGRPSRCPSCGEAGYLDRVDVERHVMFQHCPSCWNKWEVMVEE